jgi:hypothetical protein
MQSILRVMADHRVTELYLPLIGAGRGGLPADVALLYLALAVSDMQRSLLGRNLHSINVVVFQKNEHSEPEIPRKTARQILAFVDSVVCDRS